MTRIFVGLLASFSPTILLSIALVKNYYHPQQSSNSDFEIASPSIVVAFFIGIWTFYLYIKNKPIDTTYAD